MARTYKGPFFTSQYKDKLNNLESIIQTNSASWDEITPINISNSTGLNTVDAVLSASYEGVVWDLTLKNGLNVRMSNVMMVWNSGGEFEYTETSTADLGSTAVITLSTTMISNSAILQSNITDGSTWVIKGNRSTI